MEEIKIPQEWNKFYLKDVSFVNLMTRRIFNVLIVANPYDAFMLEDDGRIDEKIFDEYMELGMRYPPTFTQVSTTEEANEVLHTTDIDLVICIMVSLSVSRTRICQSSTTCSAGWAIPTSLCRLSSCLRIR